MNTLKKNRISSNIELMKLLLNKNYDYSLLHKFNIIKEFNNCFNSDSKSCISSQIFDELGLIPDDQNYYLGYLNALKNTFDIGCNILEIGGGCIPSFSQKIANEQIKINKGTITVYDPLLIKRKKSYPNLSLKKENFTFDTNISNYDLLVSILPCTSTLVIVEKALMDNKDFFIGLCGCVHDYGYGRKVYEYYLSHSDEYIETILDYINERVRAYGRSDINILYLEDNYNVFHPIVYSKVKKKNII